MPLILAAALFGCAAKNPTTPVRLSSGGAAKASPEQIIQTTSPAIAAGDASPDVYLDRGRAYYQMRQFDLAQKDFEAARQKGSSAATLYDLGTTAYMLGDYDKAQRYFTEAIAADGGMARAYNNRGVAEYAKGDYARAVTDFTTAVQLSPDVSEESRFNRALVYQAMKDFDRALADYDRILAANPNHVAALNNKADILMALRRYDEAATALDAAVRISPTDPDLYFNRGLAQEKRGNYQQALQDYDHAAKLRANFAEAYRNRGVLRLRMHDTAEGCADLALACELGQCSHFQKAKNFGLCQ